MQGNTHNSDILENEIMSNDAELLSILLIDRSKSLHHDSIRNIIWGTDNYKSRGDGYDEFDELAIESIIGEDGLIIQPRVNKSREEQDTRAREKAEVFTPAWICNKQNNLIDAAWFGTQSPFNIENEDNTWICTSEPIPFPTKDGKSWEEYVRDTRLEITCGEAPYLASRYGVVSGNDIPVNQRVGLLDRKLRVVSENINSSKDWMRWATIAYQNIYGYEWQGDNLLLARQTLLYTFFDYYRDKFGKMPARSYTKKIAEIISWNLWQMDGLKGVIPGSCHEDVEEEFNLFGECSTKKTRCRGCEKNDLSSHNGIYCQIMDWEKKKPVRYIDLIKN